MALAWLGLSTGIGVVVSGSEIVPRGSPPEFSQEETEVTEFAGE
jgi:hypothetical protein